MGRQWILAIALASGAISIAAGVWLALTAFRTGSAPLGISALALLLVAPALANAAVLKHHCNSHCVGNTPESVLLAEMRRADAALRAARLGRGHMALAASHVLLLWICEAGGLISARGFLMIYALVWVSVASVYLPWLASQDRRIREERALSRHLLGLLREGDRNFRPLPP
jgi:hypothetical protein